MGPLIIDSKEGLVGLKHLWKAKYISDIFMTRVWFVRAVSVVRIKLHNEQLHIFSLEYSYNA